MGLTGTAPGQRRGLTVGSCPLLAISRTGTLPKRLGRGAESIALPAGDGGLPGPGGVQLPGGEADRAQNVWQWMLESERQNKHKPHR